MSVDEYLRTSYKAAGEYRDGVRTQKQMAIRKHALIQFSVNRLIHVLFPHLEAASKLTVRLSE